MTATLPTTNSHNLRLLMDLSIIVPLYNEQESLPELTERIAEALSEGTSYEIIFVDDGSTDASWQCIQDLRARHSYIRGIRFRRNYGRGGGSGFLGRGTASTRRGGNATNAASAGRGGEP